MTPSLRGVARSGLEAAKVLGVLLMFFCIGVLFMSPFILAAFWYTGVLSFEAATIVLLILAAYGGSA